MPPCFGFACATPFGDILTLTTRTTKKKTTPSELPFLGHILPDMGLVCLRFTAKFRKAKLAISAVRRTSIMHYALCIMH